METESTPCTLTITGTETARHSASIETVTKVLNGIQKTAYLLATAKHQQPLQKRFSPSKDIKRLYTLQVGIPEPGSYRLPINQLSLEPDLFPEHDILSAVNELFATVASGSRERLQGLLPDSRFLEKVLREMARFLPRPGSRWGMSFQHGAQPPVALESRVVRTVEHWLLQEEEQDATMTVTGELIRIDFDKNLVTLRYPPTARELECSYVQDIEDTIVENRRGLIQVTGRFTLDTEGHPKSLTDVSRIEPVDLSQMIFDSFEQGERALRLDPPLVLEPFLDEESQQLLIVTDDAFDLRVYAQTREQLADDLAAEMFFLWDEYGKEPAEQLTVTAQQLQAALLNRCREEKTHAA